MRLIAYKTFKDSPNPPDGVPLVAISHFVEISPNDKMNYEKLGFAVVTKEDFAQYKNAYQEDYEIWYENHFDKNSVDRLRVMDLVQDEFKFYHPSKIDFRRHLKPGISLDKKVLMLPNGRPEKSQYYYFDKFICEIKFQFEVDQFNFVTKRQEFLGYVTSIGEIKKYYLIHEQTYSALDPHQNALRVAERVQARSYIINEIKAILESAIAKFYFLQGKTYEEILQNLGQFYSEYNDLIQIFVNTGSKALRDKVLSEPSEGIFSIVVTEETGQTVKELLLERLTY